MSPGGETLLITMDAALATSQIPRQKALARPIDGIPLEGVPPRYREAIRSLRGQASQALGAHLHDPSDASRARLNDLAWSLASHLFRARLGACLTEEPAAEEPAAEGPEEKGPPSPPPGGSKDPLSALKSLSLTDPEILITDFGLLDIRTCQGEVPDVKSLLADQDRSSGFVRILYLHRYLRGRLEESFNICEIRDVDSRAVSRSRDLEKTKADLAGAVERRNQIASGREDAEGLAEAHRLIDQILPACVELGHRAVVRRNLSEEERDSLRRITEAYNNFCEHASGTLRSYQERAEWIKCQTEISQLARRAATQEADVRALREREEGILAEIRQARAAEWEETLEGGIQRIQLALERAGGGASEPPRFVLERAPDAGVRQLSALVGRLLRIDQRMESAWAHRIWPPPTIVLLPGSGHAFYESEERVVWVPLRAAEDFRPFTKALAEYHFYSSPESHSGFKHLPPYRNIPSQDGLARAFAEAYLVYLEWDSRGFRRLPTQVRKWLRNHLLRRI